MRYLPHEAAVWRSALGADAPWTPLEHLTADVSDALAWISWQLGGAKPSQKPKPRRRPNPKKHPSARTDPTVRKALLDDLARRDAERRGVPLRGE